MMNNHYGPRGREDGESARHQANRLFRSHASELGDVRMDGAKPTAAVLKSLIMDVAHPAPNGVVPDIRLGDSERLVV